MKSLVRYVIIWAVLFGVPLPLSGCALYHACREGLCR
jgi:hypothetical protein